jgi:hypothetical protein
VWERRSSPCYLRRRIPLVSPPMALLTPSTPLWECVSGAVIFVRNHARFRLRRLPHPPSESHVKTRVWLPCVTLTENGAIGNVPLYSFPFTRSTPFYCRFTISLYHDYIPRSAPPSLYLHQRMRLFLTSRSTALVSLVHKSKAIPTPSVLTAQNKQRYTLIWYCR